MNDNRLDSPEFVKDRDPIVPEPYTYENIYQNPILKPISEVDRSLYDIDEMIDKKLTDAKRDREWITTALNDNPEYSDVAFIARLLKLVQEVDDVIKFLILEKRNLRECIQEINEIVTQRYGVKVSQQGDSLKVKVHETKIPEGSERKYLEKISKHSDKKTAEIAMKLLEDFDKNIDEEDLSKRFYQICGRGYDEFKDKKDKDIIAKIVRMQL